MSMTTLQASHSNIREPDLTAALSALRAHGLVLIPTDTVWSVACDATDEGGDGGNGGEHSRLRGDETSHD